MFRPLGNSTVLPAAGWHPEPQTRGTFSILSSCLITMSLCIWTSLHLNLPEHKKEHLQKYRKLGWMIVGLIAPEMVVWNAWSQRKKMKKLSNYMQYHGFMPKRPKLWMRVRSGVIEGWQWTLVCLLLKAEDLPELAGSASPRRYNGRVHPWTDVHSWLVVMGGFSFEDSADEDQQFMPENRQRMNITVKGFTWIKHLIPDISREYIQDKSKSDRLAKLLTCWQAGYFCIQCVSRLSQQLSVTLLELNVFAHALCALALFMIWSDKPRDVCEPTLIVGQAAMDLCGLFCVKMAGDQKNFQGYETESFAPDMNNPLEITHPTSFSCYYDDNFKLRYGALRDRLTLKVLEIHWTLKGCRVRRNTDFIVTLNDRDLRRLQRVSRFLLGRRSRSLESDARDVYTYSNRARTPNRSLEFSSIHDFMKGDSLTASQRSSSAWIAAGLTFAGACYGGIHLVAWKTPFASSVEALLWRAACVSIIATGPSCVMFAACFRFISFTVTKFYQKFRSSHGPVSIHRILWECEGNLIDKVVVISIKVLLSFGSIFLFYCLVSWYIFCRVFIVVESFIMLAHTSEQALNVPTWSAYLPHIA